LLVIGANGNQLGILSRSAALAAADQAGLDLLCVAPGANPPVCKIVNYGKYRFEMQKKNREAKKHQHIVEIKEVQITPQIGDHDLLVKVKNAIRFFEEGNKVKVVLRFRGRQMTHLEIGDATMAKFIEMVGTAGSIEKKPSLDGKLLTAYLTPKTKK
jgi:translation initiation factor IF-3